jgi:superfamily II DNA or RNA helicase
LALTAEQLRLLRSTLAIFSRATQRRGEQYFDDGRVVELVWNGAVVGASVIGNDDYEVLWSWLGKAWANDCSCPVGYECKHAYAVGLAMLSRFSAAPMAVPAPPPPARPPAPPARRDLADTLAAVRDVWRRRELVGKFLSQAQIRGLSAYDPRIEELLGEADVQMLCWQLAQRVLAHTGGALPAALEPYRTRPDLAARRAQRDRQVLVNELLEWTRERQVPAPRAVRFVCELVPAHGGKGVLRIVGRVTSHRVPDQERRPDQLRQLHAEAQRMPGLLAPDMEALLAAYLEESARGGNYGDGDRVNLVVAMLKSVDDPGPLLTWADDLDPELAARAGITPGAPLRLGRARVRLLPAAVESGDGARLDLACLWPDGNRRWMGDVVYVPGTEYPRSPAAVISDGSLHVVAEEPPLPLRQRFLALGGIELPRAACAEVLAPLAQRFPHLRETLAARTALLRGTPLIALDLREDDWLQLRLFFTDAEDWLPGTEAPAGAIVLELTPQERWQRPRTAPEVEPVAIIAAPEPAGAAVAADGAARGDREPWIETPDPAIVEPAIAWLASTGAEPGAHGRPGGHQPTAPDSDVGWWMQASTRRMRAFAEAWPARPPGIRFAGTARIRRLLAGGQVVRPSVRVTASGVDWFAVAADWEAEGLSLTDADLAKLRTADSPFVRLPSGWVRRDAVDAHDASAAVLADLGVEVGGGEQRISIWQLAGAKPESLAALEGMAAGREALAALAALRRRVEAFTGVPEVPVSPAITAELRPYQRRGLDFLAHAADLGIGAVLADDMGLGKTLQALAWLQHLIDRDPGGGPSLVVCPTSVMHNWQREAALFAPRLRVLLLERGAQRHALRQSVGDHDLVVTNYALLRRDLEQWRALALRAVIFDEAQNIKNPDAAVSQAAAALRARHRLALTGTPLENRPLDLWSITHAVTPGYLGSRSDFAARFDRLDAPPHARALLAAKLRPMLLRRLKREVAADLPERIEERRDCELTDGQRQLYLAELRRSRRLIAALSSDAAALRKNKITILAALTRLRQICCHPALAKGRVGLGSGKFDAVFELLEPLLAEGHKVLLFSQFVQCLRLLAAEMAQRGIAHHVLTGQTTKRDTVVRGFQEDERPGVFLISLKAGGTGLNLTAASYVVLFDPWWNPAVEAQAIDRTHRIGQDRTVIAYRLIARGTIEEKIWELQQRKAEMVRDILGESGFARALDRSDLDFLLQDA